MTGSWSNKIKRSQLVTGDHIYRFSHLHLRVCHGIYVEADRVIYFKCRRRRVTRNDVCERCGHERALRGVVKSCLDCFLQGHQLYRFKYNVRKAYYLAKNSGTCYTGPCEKPDIVVKRTKKMLEKRNSCTTTTNADNRNDRLFEKNSVFFGVYCMTGSIASAETVAKNSKVKMGLKVLQVGLEVIGVFLGMKEIIEHIKNNQGHNENDCDNENYGDDENYGHDDDDEDEERSFLR